MNSFLAKTRQLFGTRIAVVLTYGAFSLLFVVLITRNINAISHISLKNAAFFVLALGFSFFVVAAQGYVNKATFQLKGKRSLSTGMMLAMYNAIGNYLPLSAGLIAKGFLLKKNHNVRYDTYAAISILTFASFISVSGLLGLLAILWSKHQLVSLMVGYGLMLLVPSTIFLPIDKIPLFANRGFMKEPIKSRSFFKKIFWKVFLAQMAIIVFSSVRFGFCFSVIGADWNGYTVIMLVSASTLTRLVAITPGGIGVREAIIAAVAIVMDSNYELAILASGINRVAHIIFVFSGVGIGNMLAKKGTRKHSDETPPIQASEAALDKIELKSNRQ